MEMMDFFMASLIIGIVFPAIMATMIILLYLSKVISDKINNRA
jgi:hypothetical protein